ncbi:MAG: hypothetical protein ACR2L2_10095 [Acidobacteriota bacterium]
MAELLSKLQKKASGVSEAFRIPYAAGRLLSGIRHTADGIRRTP